LSPPVRADLTRLHTQSPDYLAGLDTQQKVESLKRMSYQDFLVKHAQLLPDSLPFFAGLAFRNNMRVDTCPAYTAARSGAPGFKGVALPDDPPFHSDYEFHFPDGNASLARLLVSRLAPAVFGRPQAQDTIITAAADYARLDLAVNSTRIRLQSTVVRAEHVSTDAVRVVYSREGKLSQVIGSNVVMACFNNIIPYLVPDLPN